MRKRQIFLTTGVLLVSVLALAGCKVAVLSEVQLACDASGMAEATFHWTPVDDRSAVQYLDLSLDETFPSGVFIGAGPFPADRDSYSWAGLMPGATHFWRVNTLIDGNWRASATGSFTTPCVQERIELGIAQGVNDIRNEHGLPALARDPTLSTVARALAQDMVDKGYFGTTPPDGCGAACRVERAGIKGAAVGEVIQQCTYSGVEDAIKGAIERWRNSDSILGVIATRGPTLMGTGSVIGADGLVYTVAVIVELTQASPLLTPTAAPTNSRTRTPTQTPTVSPTSFSQSG